MSLAHQFIPWREDAHRCVVQSLVWYENSQLACCNRAFHDAFISIITIDGTINSNINDTNTIINRNTTNNSNINMNTCSTTRDGSVGGYGRVWWGQAQSTSRDVEALVASLSRAKEVSARTCSPIATTVVSVINFCLCNMYNVCFFQANTTPTHKTETKTNN